MAATGTTDTPTPAPKPDRETLEAGSTLMPRFGPDGMIPCISQDADTGDVLMFAYMNAESFRKTVETGQVHFWSRSRGKLWLKGESSGMTQHVIELRLDCDQDCVLARVRVGGSTATGVAASCHTGHPNCFYRRVRGVGDADAGHTLETTSQKVFDPDAVYGS